MLPTLTASLVASTLLLCTTTAAPTRTHCRCTTVADAVPDAAFTPSAAHWTSAESTPSPVPRDFCSNLGPELESFQHSKPDLYQMYLGRTEGPASNNDHQQPFKTIKVSVNFAARKDSRGSISKSEWQSTTRSHQRIVCHAESDLTKGYQGSFVTLWALQIIVAIGIIACIAEGLCLSLSWLGNPSTVLPGDWKSGPMRISGNETVVLQMSSSTYKPGTPEQTYDAAPMLVLHAPNGDRICITYEEDDDEVYRPVM